MAGLLSDPYRLNMLLNGFGLLTSKYEDQADRYKQGAMSGLLQQSQINAKAKEKEADREYNQPLRDLQGQYLQSQIGLNQSKIDAAGNRVPEPIFGGNSMPAQAANIISTLGAKRQRGEPLSKEEENALTYAIRWSENARYYQTPQGTLEVPGISTDFLGGQVPQQPIPPAPQVSTQQPVPPVSDQPVDKGPTLINQPASKGSTAVDQKFAAEYIDWTTKGFSDAEKGIAQLNEALKDLTSGKTKTGGVEAGLNTILPDSVMGFVAPDFVNTKDQIEEVVQRNLRLILGAQFTEKEGARLIARAYNPALSTEQNIARVKRLVKQIEDAAQAKQAAAKYWEANNGTLSGFKGKVYTASDFDPDVLFGEEVDDEYEQLKQKYLQ